MIEAKINVIFVLLHFNALLNPFEISAILRDSVFQWLQKFAFGHLNHKSKHGHSCPSSLNNVELRAAI